LIEEGGRGGGGGGGGGGARGKVSWRRIIGLQAFILLCVMI
jgi:hypothetical protein